MTCVEVIAMTMKDLVRATRSCRRFDQSCAVSLDVLVHLVDLARCTASGGNLQPLKYVLSCEEGMNEKIFTTLGWAAYFTSWPGPEQGQRPTGYIVICHDKKISEKNICDHGIASQTIMLAATEQGLGSCILASVNREKLADHLDLPANLDILLVVALGKPAEACVLEDVQADGSVKYYRDAQSVHHVPKRSLEDIIVARHC